MRIIDCFEKGARLDPDAPMFIDAASGRQTSFAEVRRISERLAAAISAGWPTADQPHLGVYSPNDPRAYACVLAGWRAGAVWVPINAKNSASGNAEFCETAKVSLLFYHSSFAEAVEVVRRQVPSIRLCVCIDREMGADPSLEGFMARYPDAPVPDLEDDVGRRVAIFGSGGTTGKSKGILHSSLVWETMINTGWQLMPYDGQRPVHLLAAPMTHGAGGLATVLLPWGTTHVILDKIDPLVLMQAIERYRVTHLFLPPTVVYAMLAHPSVRDHDFSSLKYFICSAAPVAPEKLKEAVQVFGPCMCSCWAQAESPFFLTWLSPKDVFEAATVPGREHLLKSCGRAVIANRVEVMDPEGELLGEGKPGELVMKGHLRMVEYFDNPEATAEIRDAKGWQHTGDVGFRDADGYFYIVDRIKDMIVTGGFNVFPAEVEKHLASHPAVQDSAVYGIPDEKWGEAVHASVQLKASQSVSAEALIDFCKKELSSVKAPKSIEFVDQLPRSPVGKVLKRALRERFWTGRERRV